MSPTWNSLGRMQQLYLVVVTFLMETLVKEAFILFSSKRYISSLMDMSLSSAGKELANLQPSSSISIGMTASTLYVGQKGVSHVVD